MTRTDEEKRAYRHDEYARYRAKHKEEIRVRDAKYKADHREERLKKGKVYYEAHHEERLAYVLTTTTKQKKFVGFCVASAIPCLDWFTTTRTFFIRLLST